LVKNAYVPFRISPQLTRGVAGRSDGLTIRVANPNSFPLSVTDLVLRLPSGIRYAPGSNSGGLGRLTVQSDRLTWHLAAPVLPSQVLLDHIALRIGQIRSTTLTATLHAATPDGAQFAVSSRASLRFTLNPIGVHVSVAGKNGSMKIEGTIDAPLTTAAKRRPSGSLLLRLSQHKAVTIRPTSLVSNTVVGAPTRLAIAIQVVGSEGLPACRGRSGVLRMIDSDAIVRASHTRDQLTLRLSCGVGTRTFADAASANALMLKVAYR
jgi:hypothetical protein